MSGSNYLVAPPARRKINIFRKFVPFVSAALAFIIAIVSLGAGLFIKPQEAEAGPIEWIVCEWAGKDSIAYFAYEAAFTDNVAYMFNSKSAISSGTEDVAGGMNILLGLTHDFTAVNERIMGTGLKPTNEYEGEINGGVKVNPYDRFGVAGMYWSSYSGEWNYLKVDVCGGGSEPVNMRIGAFYDDRLAPLSTYGGIAQSTDVRSLAAAQKGLVLANDWVNIVANLVFNITKFTVVVTNALIGIAFSDILGFLGLTDLIGADDGIFSKFYTGVYLPLIILVMLIMATWAFWHGIVKRSYRRTLAGIAQSIALFFMAAVVALNPLFFIALPNNIAIVAQSLIVNSLSSSIYAGDGLCAVGGIYTVNANGEQVEARPNAQGQVDVSGDGSPAVTDVEANRNLLEQASQSMQSVIGCQLWYTYVLGPWSSGQYGTDMNNLWAKGHADDVFGAGPEELNNDNEAWVGDAAVPLGGGYTINNWAIFQISTQTNAHVPLGQEEPGRSIYTDGVANDWWRIVDAVSNYNETTQANGIPGGCTGTPADAAIVDGAGYCVPYNPAQTTPVDSTIPDVTKKPTDYWQNWIGAKPGDRMAAAFGSVVPAILGNLAPLVFAGMSAVFAIAIAIAMAVAPLFLLLGSWPGNGWNIFKSWGQLVLNLTMKRIIAGILLVLSLILITMILQLTSGNPFIGFIVLAVVSIGLFKFRNQIFDRLSGIFTFNFASSDIGATGARAWNKFAGGTKATAGFAARAGAGAAMGAGIAAKAGESRWSGMVTGVKNEVRNTVYRSPTWNTAVMDAEALKGSDIQQRVSASEICAYCSRPLYRGEGSGEAVFNGGIDFEGNFVCEECMDNPEYTLSGIDPYEHGARRVRRNYLLDDADKYSGINFNDGKVGRHSEAAGATVISESTMEPKLEELKTFLIDDKTGEVNNDVASLVGKIVAREVKESRVKGTSPAVPTQLRPYLTPEVRETIPHLWKDPNAQAKDVIAYAYAQATTEYLYDNGLKVGDLSGDISKGVKGDAQAVLGEIVNEINREALIRKNQDDNNIK